MGLMAPFSLFQVSAKYNRWIQIGGTQQWRRKLRSKPGLIGLL